jgi:hypothetical protein
MADLRSLSAAFALKQSYCTTDMVKSHFSNPGAALAGMMVPQSIVTYSCYCSGYYITTWDLSHEMSY